MNEHNHKMRAGEAARYIGLSESTMAKLRCSGDGPSYYKAGRRVVIYDKADIDAWLSSRKRQSTSEYS